MTDDKFGAFDIDSIDFFAPEVLADPYELLSRLRRERPVAKFRQAGFDRDQYVVTPYSLVEKVFRDNQAFSSDYMSIFIGEGNDEPEVAEVMARTWSEVNTLLTADEPDHTRLRSLAQRAFMPSRIRRMSGLINEVIHGLIDDFIERGECDFKQEFAIPLPINSVAAVLGIPPEYYGKLYDWTFARLRRNGQMATPEEKLADAYQILEMKEYLAELVRDRRRQPRDDLVSDLVTARIDRVSPFSELEILSTVMMILVGGAETTRGTLISTLARLTQNPDQLEMLRADLSLVPRAVDEVLRIDSPGTAIWRIAARDVELGGQQIPEGAIVMLRMDSANRDETVFAEPERFDIQRANAGKHLSFGLGIHFCIGFGLARAQLNQSLQALIPRLTGLRVIAEKSDLRTHPSVLIRCLRELHLAFKAGSRLN